jgi:hypothetical protein
MTSKLPQKYQEVAKSIVPYESRKKPGQMGLINIDPALPCVLCGRPATEAIIAPAPEQMPGAWLSFPICSACEERQVKAQAPHQD